ncbi:hypothetical protein ACKKBG_A06570 [Auxenochlorella protothecoides x Auxenochlorella symbiontica]
MSGPGVSPGKKAPSPEITTRAPLATMSGSTEPSSWAEERKALELELAAERRRCASLQEELKKEKQLAIARQLQAEAEEERLTNKLMQRLDELKTAKLTLTPEVEAEEGLVASLKRRLDTLTADKAKLEAKLASDQDYVANTLLRKIREVEAEKLKLQRDKANLENTLEAEQEYISNRLSKQLEQLAMEKNTMMTEKLELRRQVNELAASVDKLNREKVALEAQFEREEEHVVNKLQRQLQAVTIAYCNLESKLESAGISPRESGGPGLDHTIEWVYGRSPSRHSTRLTTDGRDRSRSSSRTSSFRGGAALAAAIGTPSAPGATPHGAQELASPRVSLARRSSSSVTSRSQEVPTPGEGARVAGPRATAPVG